ncbi:MAG: response regulator transcription factor [Candidatus Micrarchaeaceae archaeon]
MINLLMIEDDLELAKLLEEYLAKFNIKLVNFDMPSRALNALSKEKFDIIILDLGLPEMDGLEVAKILINSTNIPFIISSARSDDADKVTGLELGADDYIAKPYNPRELVARIDAVLRRNKKAKDNNLKTNEFEIDEKMMLIKKNAKTLDLTSAEYEVLSLLVKNKNRVITRDFILENSKTMDYESIDRSVDVIISRIRKKIDDDTKSPKYIQSIRGLGYKFSD